MQEVAHEGIALLVERGAAPYRAGLDGVYTPRPSMSPTASIPGVLDLQRFDGARADPGALADLVIEVPHGATATVDFTSLAQRLKSPLPDALVDFFHVNTDAGAPELARAVAARFVEDHPARAALVLRCRVPRTFIDCNRKIDAAPEDFKAGKVTPGLMPWVTDPDDRALLQGLYDSYVRAVGEAVEGVMRAGGAMVMLHTYAPRSVDVEVDQDIVTNLHRAYEPDVQPTWPLRPEVDLICRAPDGTSHAPAAVVMALQRELKAVDVTAEESATYPLHPSTLAWHHVMAWPGRTLCIEVRRDLVADPFEPFAEMKISAVRSAHIAHPIARALAGLYTPSSGS